jgi:Fic family protein
MRGELVHKTWPAHPELNAPIRFRHGCEYAAFIPSPLEGIEPQLPASLARTISDAERAISDLNRDSGTELLPLARLLLRTESIASSKVEGMQVDARALLRAEAKQEAGLGIGSNVAEILGNIDAMQLAIERASSLEGIQVKDILDIHRALLDRAPNPRIAGRLRTSQNWIGGNDYNPCGADFVPPPPEEVSRLLEDLCRFCNDDTLPVLVQAAIAHAQFETIHPFDDGNGRTGRALIHVVLRRRALAQAFVPPISAVLAREKARYVSGLTLFREDRIPEWLEIFADAAARSAGLAMKYKTEVAALQEGWRRKLREHSNPRADAAAWAIIDALPGYPIVTVPVAVAATKRTRPAVANAVVELEDAGILRRLSESARNRAWEAEDLSDLIVRLEVDAE